MASWWSGVLSRGTWLEVKCFKIVFVVLLFPGFIIRETIGKCALVQASQKDMLKPRLEETPRRLPARELFFFSMRSYPDHGLPTWEQGTDSLRRGCDSQSAPMLIQCHTPAVRSTDLCVVPCPR